MDYINTIITNYIPIPNIISEKTSDFIKDIQKALYSLQSMDDCLHRLVNREGFIRDLIIHYNKLTERQLYTIFSYINIERVLNELVFINNERVIQFIIVLVIYLDIFHQ